MNREYAADFCKTFRIRLDAKNMAKKST